MTHHATYFLAAVLALLVLSVSAFPAHTAPKPVMTSWDVVQPENVQAAQVHALVGASFHAIHASF